MNLQIILFSFLLLGFNISQAQVNLDFKLLGKDLNLSSDTVSLSGEKQIDKVKIYLSNFKLYKNEELVYLEEDSYHLLDFSQGLRRIALKKIPQELEYTHLVFDLGIDSLTNEGGARGGALDPSKGMYWSWQSGYINFKIEGTAAVCPSRKNKFQFHAGGFLDGDDCVQRITLKLEHSGSQKIYIDLDDFFEGIDLKTQYEVMSPGAAARGLAALLSKCFKPGL